jgi:cell division protein FtsW
MLFKNPFSTKKENSEEAEKLLELNNYPKETIDNDTEEFDTLLFWAVSFLVALGFVMVFSASLAIAEGTKMTGYKPYYFAMRHGIYICIGAVAGLIAFRIPTEKLKEYALPLFLVGTLLLIIVLIPGIGREVNGARRWIGFAGINFQPSELMKILAVLYASDYISRKKHVLDNIKLSFIPMFFVIVVIGGLLLSEPDFGAFIVISFISFSILFLGGVQLRGFIVLIILAIIGFVIIIISSPYRVARVVGFLDPWSDPYGKGYQLSHSLIAFGRGEFWGVGLGGSIEKLFYLPEAHTDFIMAVTGEELGFLGVCVVISLFALIVYRAFKIGEVSSYLYRDYSSLVAKGIGLWFGFQAFINIGVNVGLLPTKGLTLPLMSFGGSSIVANFIALAIIFRIDWDNRKILKYKYIEHTTH